MVMTCAQQKHEAKQQQKNATTRARQKYIENSNKKCDGTHTAKTRSTTATKMRRHAHCENAKQNRNII